MLLKSSHMPINWSTERRKVSELRDYDKNPRKFTDKGMKDLAASIERLGYIDPIAINLDGTIIGGHARKGTLKKLGIKEVDVRVPDRQLTEKEVEEAIIRLNKNIAGEWDLDKLALDFEQSDLIDWGFEPGDFGVEPEVIEGLTDEDAVPEPPPEPITKPGDIWILGNHRVMCGDSTSIDAVERLMDGQKAGMLHTDPPYGVDFEGVTNDHLKAEELQRFLTDSLTNAFLVLGEASNVYVWHADVTAYEFIGAFRAAGFKQARPSTIQWIKPQLTMSQGDYHSQNEPCLFGWKEGRGRVRVADRKQTTLWEINRTTENKIHPTMKPVELCERAILNSSKEKFIVLDLFLGSGSTLIACEKTGRTCYGMELSPHYCDVIVKRWEDFTGKKAVLEQRDEVAA